MPTHISVDEFWGYGVSRVKKAILGTEGDHLYKEWRDEFKAFFS